MTEIDYWTKLGHALFEHNRMLHTGFVSLFRDMGLLTSRERGSRGWDRAGNSLRMDDPRLFALLKRIVCKVLDGAGVQIAKPSRRRSAHARDVDRVLAQLCEARPSVLRIVALVITECENTASFATAFVPSVESNPEPHRPD